MIQGHCKNHPNRTARRRCFTCGSFICATCQIRAAHHYFCSSGCQLKFQLREFRDLTLELLHSLVPSLHLPKKKAVLGSMIAGVVVVLFVMPLFALIFVIYLNFRLQDRIGIIELALKNSTISPAQPSSPAKSAGRLRIAHPANGATLSTKLTTLKGEADANVMISLAAGNKVLAATVPSAGRFSFPNLALNNGENHFEVRATNAHGDVLGLEAVVLHYRPPTIFSVATDFSRGNRKIRQIALTFDGGSNDNSAQAILAILQQHDLRVTIFLTGGFIKNFPEITREIVAVGHEVGNHTWSHPHLTSFGMNYQHHTLPEVNREFLHEQILKTADLFEKVTGKRMAPLWRAPYGEHNQQIRQWAAELGYRHIGWTLGRSAEESLDTMDWVSDTTSASYRSAKEILQRLLLIANGNGDAANGGIVLMHLGSQRHGDEAYQILPQLIEELRANDYEIVTVSQMLD